MRQRVEKRRDWGLGIEDGAVSASNIVLRVSFFLSFEGKEETVECFCC